MLLGTVSSLHRVGTKAILHHLKCTDQDFIQTPNLFTAIVGESSQKKTPIFKAMATRPLQALRDREREKHEDEMREYENQSKRYRRIKDEDERDRCFADGEPKRPRQRVHYFTHATGEGIVAQVQAYPEHALLWHTDELAGALKSHNAYRGGKGSDEEDLLSYYDGTGATILRADGLKANLEHLNLAIVGTIQPGVLGKLVGTGDDENGKWARFMFCHQPLAASVLPDSGSGSFDLTGMLSDLYRRIDELEPNAYELDPTAFKYFKTAIDAMELERVDHKNQSMRAVIGKTEGRIGRIALNLHIIRALFEKRMPAKQIDGETMINAIALGRFYMNQIEALYFNFDDPNALAPNLAKVIQIAKKKGGVIGARDVSAACGRNKPNAATVKSWFTELVAIGHGTINEKGTQFTYGKHQASTPVAESKQAIEQTQAVSEPEVIEPVPVLHSAEDVHTSDVSEPMMSKSQPESPSESPIIDVEAVEVIETLVELKFKDSWTSPQWQGGYIMSGDNTFLNATTRNRVILPLAGWRLPLRIGDRVSYQGKWNGRIAGMASQKWVVEWDKPSISHYGNPECHSFESGVLERIGDGN